MNSADEQPLVSIGLPVYQGMPHLREAIDSLLAQDYRNLEVIISDNASDDGTAEFCRAAAVLHPHVRYTRQPQNLGPWPNFAFVLAQARGRYFMWAAHDDTWSSNYVSQLVSRLLSHPTAVLATPSILHTEENGELKQSTPDRAARSSSRRENLRLFFHDHSASWIYGLYEVEWLRNHFQQIREYPIWGGDILWLADLVQQNDVTGAQRALLFKRSRRSGWSPSTAREVLVFWTCMAWYLCRNAWRANRTRRQKLSAISLCLAYVWGHYIRRPGILRTGWRVLRTVVLAALETIPWAIRRVINRRRSPHRRSPVQASSEISLESRAA